MEEARYREAEARLWGSVGLEPSERWVPLTATGTQVRVQEVGEGDPVLFVHGGPNAGSTWAPMLEHLGGFRCLLVDRPGTGLSEPYAITADNLPEFGAAFAGDVLTGLGIDSAHLVASSFGGHLALRAAAAHPERFRCMVQVAAPAMIPGQSFPLFMRLMTIGPVRRLMNALPPNERATRNAFRQIGHGASLDAGRFPQSFIDWYMDLSRYTDTMRNDGEMIADVTPKREAVNLTPELLGSVSTSTLFLWGADDGFAGKGLARKVTGEMPSAKLVMLPEAGHLPWLDDPAGVAEATRRFLVSE